MPGICGALGADKEEYRSYWREFSQPWTDCELISFPGGFLGGHAFGSATAVRTLNEHRYCALDGETSIYSVSPREEMTGLARPSGESLDLGKACKGNVAHVDVRSRVCHLEAEQTGTFPLYYTRTTSGQLLFSSRLRPLARAVHAAPDSVGISEFLAKRHTFHRRTQYQNIFRLLPGQVVDYHLDSCQLTVREPRITWVGNKEMYPGPIDCEVLWNSLNTAVRRSFDLEKRHALMMSGGWDSRLLLSAMVEQLSNHKVIAYSWGDPRSRELQIVNKICRSVGVECILEPLDDTLYEPGFLGRAFNRVEHVLFPQWYRASEQLSGIGVQSVSAGVYGEILGGHYGPSMALTGMRKAIAVGAALIGIPVQFNSFERLRFPGVPRKPRFLTMAAWTDMCDTARQMNNDIDSAWQDIEKLGTENREQLMEAFVALTRGSRYINQQILSCRTDLDVALPFIDIDLLTLASQIPQSAKIHNTISRRLLRQYGSPLLQFTTGATLVPASMPIVFQEASRAIRTLHDNVYGTLSRFTKGAVGPSRSDFLGLDFLRNGTAFRRILDDLRLDIWDRVAIEQSIKNVAEHKEAATTSLVNISSNFLTIYTTDLMLR